MSMLHVSDIIAWLKTKFPGTEFYNGFIPKNSEQCVGVYLKQRGSRNLAIGGPTCTSYATLPLSLLVHWTKDADPCEKEADEIYSTMETASGESAGGHRIIDFNLIDPGPVDVSRDENNICEMVIRVNVIYERMTE